MLLALVMGVALVLVGVTGSALVAVTGDHVRSATLTSVVSRDAALVELFVNGTLRASDPDADGPGAARTFGGKVIFEAGCSRLCTMSASTTVGASITHRP